MCIRDRIAELEQQFGHVANAAQFVEVDDSLDGLALGPVVAEGNRRAVRRLQQGLGVEPGIEQCARGAAHPGVAAARPPVGLRKVGVVIGQRVEYNLTRFTVIYYSQGAARVGSIRSARLPDLEWPAVFDAVLCFSGGVEPVRQKLYASDFADRILEQARNGSAYFRDPKIAVPNHLFASTTTLWLSLIHI